MPVTQVLSILADKGVTPAIGVEVFNLDNYVLGAAEVAAEDIADEAPEAAEELSDDLEDALAEFGL